jgi:large subunit ribosomal protein L35
MPKAKTRKAVSKRFRVTKNGKVLRRSSGARHLATGKTRKRKRILRGSKVADPVSVSSVKSMIPHG